MRKRTWTVHIENGKSLARRDLPVIGIATGAIEAGDALEDVVLWLGQINFCRGGLRERRWEHSEQDQQQDKNWTERVHHGLLFIYLSDLLGGFCTEVRILTSVRIG